MIKRPFTYAPPLVPFLDILYEDEDIMVINKPSNILSVPGKEKTHHDSILSRVKSIHENAFAVHRLDYGTSGVLVVGLNKEAISNLGKQFISRIVHKAYIAWVDGKLELELNTIGKIDLPLILDINNRPYQKIDFTHGKAALTYYEPLFYDAKLKRTLVLLYPQTGRSHQLRVHMMALGHSILGDHLYADDQIYAASPYLNLHAALLSFLHPKSSERLTYLIKPEFFTPTEILSKLTPELISEEHLQSLEAKVITTLNQDNYIERPMPWV